MLQDLANRLEDKSLNFYPHCFVPAKVARVRIFLKTLTARALVTALGERQPRNRNP